MSRELFIGLMSGTSIDGVDCSIVAFEANRVEVISTYFEKCPRELRENILSICQGSEVSLKFLGETDIALGKLFASVVNKQLEETKINPKAITAIGSHGQTVWHQPSGNYPFTMQIGDPNVICQQTGITTVAGFRQKDVANGGQGAPLAPLFHKEFFHRSDFNRAIINIGGIANITILPREGVCSAYDIGPGNVLMDYWSHKNLGIRYDKNGEWAATGECNQELLQEMLKETYLKQPPPKSTGRELFNGLWLEGIISRCNRHLRTEDVQATLSVFTSQCIADAINNSAKDTEVYICGGGADNSCLMNNLKTSVEKRTIMTTSALGIEPEWVEAATFAWLAKKTIRSEKLETAPFTGAASPCMLGGIYHSD